MEVNLEIIEGVGIIQLNAPSRKNALTLEMAEELLEIVNRVNSDATIASVVLHGAGDSFCSGAHRDLLALVGEDPAEDHRYLGLGKIYQSFYEFGQMAVPTVAAVKGQVMGAGLNLMLAADVRLVGESTRVQAGFLRIGIHPGGGFFTLASRSVSDETAAALAIFGETLGAQDCVMRGLAWAGHSDDDVLDEAFKLASSAAKDSALTREVVRTMRTERLSDLPWQAALQFERASQMWSLRRRFAPGE